MYYSKVSGFIKYTTYSMILATDSKGGIGNDNGLPWPRNDLDMKWFVDNTKGKIMIMGRKTFESIGSRPLPKRINIVIGTTLDEADSKAYNELHKEDKDHGYLFFVKTVQAAKDLIANTTGMLHSGGEVMIIGGATIYEAFWHDIGRIYLTTFEGEYESDVSIKMDLSSFEEVYKDRTHILNPMFQIFDAKRTLWVERKLKDNV